MSIGCIRNTNDLQNKRKEYAEYLQLMIDNESIKEKRIKDYKNPNKPPAVPPQYKTVAEQNKDLQLQERQAIDNAKDLGLDISEARSFVMQLEQKQDGIDNLVKLNRNFPAFKKLVSERLNPKSLEANAVLNLWEEFSVNLNAITGLNSISTNSTNVYSSASDNYKKIPVQDDINGFIKVVNEDLFTNAELTLSDSLKSSLSNNLSETLRLLITKDDVEKIDDFLTPTEISQINKIAENLLSVYKIPTRNDLTNKTENIKKLLGELDDNNSVRINDEIIKDIITLNRFLSSFFDETLKKKITEYNKFIIDKITSVSTGVKEEFKKTIPANIETPEIPLTGGPTGSNKVDRVSFIMANKLYNKAKYDKTGVKTLYFPKIILDKYNKNTQTEEEIRDIISSYSNTQIGAILRQIKNKEQRRTTANKDEEATMGEKETSQRKVEETLERIKELQNSARNAYKSINLSKEEAKNIYIGSVKVLRQYLMSIRMPMAEIRGIEDELDDDYSDYYLKDDIDGIIDIFVGLIRYHPDIENYIRQSYFQLVNARKTEEEAKAKAEEEAKAKADKPMNLQQTREYIDNLLITFTYDDYYERFNHLKDTFPEYKKKITIAKSGANPERLMTINEFRINNKTSDLLNLVKKNEIGAYGMKNFIKNLKDKIVNDNYNPSNPKYQLYPKQGLGVKQKSRCGGDLIHIDIGSHIGKNYKEAEGKGVKQQMKLFEKVKKNYQSGGDQPYIKSRIKIGSGVAVAEKEPTYQEFGKFVIHIPQLRKNILNVKYASGSRPQYLPIVNIDDDTKELLTTTLETGRMSENHFNKLPQPAKDFLIKAIKGAGLQNQLFKGKDKLYATEEKEDRDRFNILKGEFDAGNDNPNLIKELRALVIKFIDTRIIPKKQGLDFLRQLN